MFCVSDFYIGQLHSQMFSNLNHRTNVNILDLSVQKTRSNENMSGQNVSGVYSCKNLHQNAHFKKNIHRKTEKVLVTLPGLYLLHLQTFPLTLKHNNVYSKYE